MSDIALDAASGDIELTAGRARLALGIEATAQLWGSHLTLFRGEWFTDRDLGIDYQNDVLEKGRRMPVLRAIFTRASLETPGIERVETMRLSLSPQRVLDVVAEVIYSDGSAGTLALSEPVGG